MPARVTSKFAITAWDEKPYDEAPGRPKLTRASVTQSYTGDIDGTGALEYLMVYGDGGSASFVSLERVVGRVGDRAGSFVLQGSGTFAGDTARGTLFVVPGSGTEDLRNLRGEGSFIARHGDPTSQQVTLDCDFG